MTMDDWVGDARQVQLPPVAADRYRGSEDQIFLSMLDLLLLKFRIIVAESISSTSWETGHNGLASRASRGTCRVTHVCISIRIPGTMPTAQKRG